MASTLASAPRSAPLVSDFGLQDGLQQPDGSSNGEQSGSSYQLASSSQTSVGLDYNYQPSASSESAPASASLLPAVPTTTETGLVGFDLSNVSDQLEFPAIPESLLEEAPEYEYSAHTRANVFSDSQLSNYGLLNNFDPYGVPFVPAPADDASWTLGNVEQFGGYDEFGNYHPPSAGAIQPSLDVPRSEVDMPNDATLRYGDTFEHRGTTRVTPPSAEYANVAASWMPVSISSSSIPHHYGDPSSASSFKTVHGDQEPQNKRRKPSPMEGSGVGGVSEGNEASRPFNGPSLHGSTSSPAGAAYVRSQPLATADSLSASNGYAHTGHRPQQQTGSSMQAEEAYQSASTSSGLLLASQPSRQQQFDWSQEVDASRGPSYRGQPMNGYARPQGSSGFSGQPNQIHPGQGGSGQSHQGPAYHGPSVLSGPGSFPNGASPPNHGFNGQQHMGYESDSFRRNKSGRDSLSQSSEEDDLDAPPPNPKAVALAAAATKGASGTQQQADMLTMLNETLSSSLETDGVARCPFPNCTKTFAKNRSYNLKTHLRSHSQLKPFACASCPRAFSRKHDLERHARVHSGDKPYICEACGRGFPRSDALRRHWRVEKDCGDRASEIEAGQPLPSLPTGSAGLTATAQVPSQMPISRFNGPNAYPAGWIREQDLGPHHNRGPMAVAGGSVPNNGMSMHMGVKRTRHDW